LTPHDFKVFGSPVYVLDKALQNGSIGPGKWKERCYQGVYVGHSPHHASNVILVYNPKTRLVFPQYHVVHDESFDTVQIKMSAKDSKAKMDAMLDDLFKSSQWHHSDAYSGCDSPSATHHYFDSSWDLAYKSAQAASQREHEQCQANGSSRKRTCASSSSTTVPLSEGASSRPGHVSALPPDHLPSRTNGHSDSIAASSPTSLSKGATSSHILTEDTTQEHSTPCSQVFSSRPSNDTADLANQLHLSFEAPPSPVLAKTTIGDDNASSKPDDIIPIVSQLGSLESPSKRL
jgi:hypothetical protein